MKLQGTVSLQREEMQNKNNVKLHWNFVWTQIIGLKLTWIPSLSAAVIFRKVFLAKCDTADELVGNCEIVREWVRKT